jgi:hypothetical protein
MSPDASQWDLNRDLTRRPLSRRPEPRVDPASALTLLVGIVAAAVMAIAV